MESQVALLKSGKIVVMPTDTIYGIVGSALNPQTVEKIYDFRKRSLNKPFIILISSLADLNKFNVSLTEKQTEFLQKNWPNPLTVVLPVAGKPFEYLHRGTNTLAFRMPKNQALIKLIKQTGPLVAPSANFEGEKVAETIDEAKAFFGDLVFYIDGGILKSESSTLIKLKEDGSLMVLRQGVFRV